MSPAVENAPSVEISPSAQGGGLVLVTATTVLIVVLVSGIVVLALVVTAASLQLLIKLICSIPTCLSRSDPLKLP